jgi:hypothetical protein
MKDIIVTGKCRVYGEYHKDYDKLTLSEIKLYKEILQLIGIDLKTIKNRSMKVSYHKKNELMEIKRKIVGNYSDDIRNEIFYILKKKIEEESMEDPDFINELKNAINKKCNIYNDFFEDFLNRLLEPLTLISIYVDWKLTGNENYAKEYEINTKLKMKENIRLFTVIKNKLDLNIFKEKSNDKENNNDKLLDL